MDLRDDGVRSTFRTIAILTLIPVAGLAVFFIWNWLNGGEPELPLPREPKPQVAAAPPVLETALPPVRPKRRRGRGEIVLIIDDLGFEGQPLDRVMSLDPNINCAILPNAESAAAFAERLNARGFEILCHLPMEPRGADSPGRNAILTSMSDDEIARATRENVRAIPHARGVNNHMGSLATTDRRVMSSVIGALPQGMYFIDSRTAGGSVAGEVAREMNVRTATRHVFLDDVPTEYSVRKQLEMLADTAERRGIAVGIGHPRPATMRVLAEELPELRARGFRLVRASEVVR